MRFGHHDAKIWNIEHDREPIHVIIGTVRLSSRHPVSSVFILHRNTTWLGLGDLVNGTGGYSK
jgi:hypothetical protein